MFYLNRSSQRFVYVLIGLVACVATLIPSQAFALRNSVIGEVADLEKTPSAYIVVDADQGTIISSKNIHQPLNVASVSKILTALAAVNTIGPDQLVDIPKEAEQVQPTRIGMKEGQKWKRNDLLYSLLLVSANDVAYALAAASAGSIPDFAKQQNRIAKELGMKDSTFGDPSGLDDDFAINGDTKMSAYDLAIAGRAALAQPEIAKIVSTMNYQFVGGDNAMHTLTNHNDTFLNGYAGANGLKTGYTQKAGRTLMVSATRGKTTLIAVVLDVNQTDEWAARLLDGSFAAISAGKVSKKAAVLPAIGVIGSKANITILKEPPGHGNSKSKSANTKIDSSNSDKKWFLSVPIVSLVVIGILASLFLWRHRVIAKRKKLRIKRAQAAKEARRRAMMDVIDLTIEEESELVSKM